MRERKRERQTDSVRIRATVELKIELIELDELTRKRGEKFLPTTARKKIQTDSKKKIKKRDDVVKTTNTSRTSSWPSASMASELRVDLRALGMVFCLFFFCVLYEAARVLFDAKIKIFTKINISLVLERSLDDFPFDEIIVTNTTCTTTTTTTR